MINTVVCKRNLIFKNSSVYRWEIKLCIGFALSGSSDIAFWLKKGNIKIQLQCLFCVKRHPGAYWSANKFLLDYTLCTKTHWVSKHTLREHKEDWSHFNSNIWKQWHYAVQVYLKRVYFVCLIQRPVGWMELLPICLQSPGRLPNIHHL